MKSFFHSLTPEQQAAALAYRGPENFGPEKMPKITRIAPSPTGDMHLGTARTAYFNWLAARATGGTFILRIDDTDVDRNREECVDVIYKTMEWLGLDADKTFRQSERSAHYAVIAGKLGVFNLTTVLDNGAVALKFHPDMPRAWTDTIAGSIAITDTNIEQIDGKTILLKGGEHLGQATYQFASVVDDWLENVNHIIRGVDHITNTAKQLCIWWAINKAFEGFGTHVPYPEFTHLGLITKDKKKLSKRDNASSLLHYRAEGYNPDAVLNFMLRLGWGPKQDDKSNSIIDRERAVRMFLTEGNMKASPAGFDQAKLDWFDKVYKQRKAA